VPKIFVIIPNFNGKKTLLKCLQSVNASGYSNLEVVVVDNDSKDGSLEEAKKYLSRAHFIKNEKNLGFATAVNIGIRFSLEQMADYIFLLNNDAEIENDTLQKLVDEMEKDKKRGVGSPLIFDKRNGKIWFAGGKINRWKMRTEHRFTALSQNSYETQYVTGCAMIIKKEVFKEVGLFDQNYFLYYEDADFCLRAKKASYKIMIFPSIKAYHLEKSEENKENKVYWLVISGLMFFQKNAPATLKPWINIYIVLRKIKNWYDVNFRKSELAKVVRKAYGDYRAIKK
jgi:hypothetical protein